MANYQLTINIHPDSNPTAVLPLREAILACSSNIAINTEAPDKSDKSSLIDFTLFEQKPELIAKTSCDQKMPQAFYHFFCFQQNGAVYKITQQSALECLQWYQLGDKLGLYKADQQIHFNQIIKQLDALLDKEKLQQYFCYALFTSKITLSGQFAENFQQNLKHLLLKRQLLEHPAKPEDTMANYMKMATEALNLLESIIREISQCNIQQLQGQLQTFSQQWGKLLMVDFVYWELASRVAGDNGRLELKREIDQQLQNTLKQAEKNFSEEMYEQLSKGILYYQQGKNAYYLGDFDLALNYYAREMQDIKQKDLFNRNLQDSLNRAIASLFSDMLLLDSCERLMASPQEQDDDYYKTLGRMAEIAIRKGDTQKARQLLNHQKEHIERKKLDKDKFRLYINLGHLEQLENHLEAAQEHYQHPIQNTIENGKNRIYHLMGLATLALKLSRLGKLNIKTESWIKQIFQPGKSGSKANPLLKQVFQADSENDEQSIMALLESMAGKADDKTMPACITLYCLNQLSPKNQTIKTLLQQAKENLLQAKYLYESLYLFSLDSSPSAISSELGKIMEELQQWQTGLEQTENRLPVTNNDKNKIKTITEQIHTCIEQDSWLPLSALWQQIYPCTLIAR